MALQFSALNSAFLEAVHEFSLGTISALSSIVPEPALGNNFRSQLYVPEPAPLCSKTCAPLHKLHNHTLLDYILFGAWLGFAGEAEGKREAAHVGRAKSACKVLSRARKVGAQSRAGKVLLSWARKVGAKSGVQSHITRSIFPPKCESVSSIHIVALAFPAALREFTFGEFSDHKMFGEFSDHKVMAHTNKRVELATAQKKLRETEERDPEALRDLGRW
ncbi:hypothetical protein B0H13DRAFT_1859415 [Mycena leptocephala]|nr:hypothetical protein B0H13DRAFT_1859415 [Mycena leptocephala]